MKKSMEAMNMTGHIGVGTYLVYVHILWTIMII